MERAESCRNSRRQTLVGISEDTPGTIVCQIIRTRMCQIISKTTPWCSSYLPLFTRSSLRLDISLRARSRVLRQADRIKAKRTWRRGIPHHRAVRSNTWFEPEYRRLATRNAVRALPALGKLCIRNALAWFVDGGGRAGGEPPVLPAIVPA